MIAQSLEWMKILVQSNVLILWMYMECYIPRDPDSHVITSFHVSFEFF